MTRMVRYLVTVLALASFGIAPPAGAETMSGDAYQLGCYPANANWYEPVTGKYDCTGYAIFRGTLNGVALFRSKGVNDAVTGDTSGTITVRIIGARVAGIARKAGQVYLSGTTSIVGSTGASKTVLTMVGGTGDFEDVQGSMTIKGTQPLSGLPATFNYTGTWNAA